MCNEFIYSTHESLLGLRSLFNIGFDPKKKSGSSRLSMGFEVYYGIASKSPGLSTALRYTTQSAYTGTPLTMTLISNPLMGHISASYALRTTAASSFASRFDFNVYSYLSDLSIGCEIWRTPRNNNLDGSDEYSSVFKASTSLGTQTLKLLWEGRYRDFLISSGVGLCKEHSSRDLDATFGIELQYSS
jgi:distribution and morphology protein 10